jgi:hypothetical protein
MEFTLLSNLLLQPEGPTLEFKSEWYKFKKGEGTDEGRTRQKGELIKDILALANGNASVAGETAYLIIGASDDLNPDGTRDLFDAEKGITSDQIRDIVNAVSDPPIERLLCDYMTIRGKCLLVISIPFSPYLHETLRILKTKECEHTEHVVFVRNENKVDIASAKERRTIERLKENYHFGKGNSNPGVLGAIVGVLVGAPLIGNIAELRNVDRKIGIGMGILISGGLGYIFGDSSKTVLQIRLDWPKITLFQKIAAILITVSCVSGYFIVLSMQQFKK